MSLPTEITCAEAWAQSMEFLALAVIAKGPMTAAPTQQERDRATKAYVAAVDGMVDALAALDAAGLLDDIGGFLDAQFGRV